MHRAADPPLWDPLEHGWRLVILWTPYTHSIHSTYRTVQLLFALASAHVVQIGRKLVTLEIRPGFRWRKPARKWR